MKKMTPMLMVIFAIIFVFLFGSCAHSSRCASGHCRSSLTRPLGRYYHKDYSNKSYNNTSNQPKQPPTQPAASTSQRFRSAPQIDPSSFQSTPTHSNTQRGELFRPTLTDAECSFTSFLTQCDFAVQAGKADGELWLKSPRTLLTGIEEAVSSRDGQGYSTEDKQKFFHFMKMPNNDPVVKIAQKNMSKLLFWLITDNGCSFDNTEFHNMVNALENLSTEKIDATFPANRGNAVLSVSIQTLRKNTLAAYIYLNMYFGPQAIQRLRDEFNIVSYGKFGTRELTNTLLSKRRVDPSTGKELPLIIVLSSTGDKGGKQYTASKLALTSSLTLTHDVRLFDISSPEDMLKGIEYIATKFGKINNLLIISHGDAYTLRVAGQDATITGAEPFLRKAAQYFASNAEGVLNACSSGGAKDGIAQNIANALGITIYAPASGTKDLLIEFTDQGGQLRISQILEQGTGNMGGPRINKFIPANGFQTANTLTTHHPTPQPPVTKSSYSQSLRELLDAEENK